MSDHGEAFGEEGYFTHPDDGLIEEILHVPLAFVGDVAKRIKIEGDGVFPTWRIHEIIVKTMVGLEEIKIQKSQRVISVGYRKDSDSRNYIPIKLGFIDPSGIRVIDLEKPENTNVFDKILKVKRREYLKQRLKKELYGIKLKA